MNDLEKGQYNLSIFNTVGQVVYQEVLNANDSQTRKSINMESHASGVYFVSLKNDKISYSNKIVK